MAICKFFQSNTCRFGSNCRHEHVFEDQYDTRRKPCGVSVLQNSKYVSKHTLKEDPDLNHHLKEINKDINAPGGVWPVSCYSYVPSFGNVEGFEDCSPEEMRLKAYQAQFTNNPQVYISDVTNLKTHAARLKQSFLDKTPAALEVLSSYLRDGPSKVKEFTQSGANKVNSGAPNVGSYSPFSSRPQNTVPASGFFSSVPQNNSSFTLSKHPAFQGDQQSSAFTSNIFAQALNEGSTVVSSNISQSQFNANFFGQALRPSFGEKTSVFGEPMQDSPVFKQNIFGNSIQPKLNDCDMTAKQASQSSTQFSFADANPLSVAKTSGKHLVYLQEADLTVEELEQFKAATFTNGKTPLKCPPKELC